MTDHDQANSSSSRGCIRDCDSSRDTSKKCKEKKRKPKRQLNLVVVVDVNKSLVWLRCHLGKAYHICVCVCVCALYACRFMHIHQSLGTRKIAFLEWIIQGNERYWGNKFRARVTTPRTCILCSVQFRCLLLFLLLLLLLLLDCVYKYFKLCCAFKDPKAIAAVR